MEDKAVGIAPVGCAVFAYNYFNCDMMEAAHGSGLRRLLQESSALARSGSRVYLSGRRRPCFDRHSGNRPCRCKGERKLPRYS